MGFLFPIETQKHPSWQCRKKNCVKNNEVCGQRSLAQKKQDAALGGVMMFCRVLSATLLGVEGLPIQVEVDVAGGLPIFVTVGLAEGAVKEAKVRVQSAIQNSGHLFPAGRVTVNLAPANLKKVGSGFDFPIALGVLGAQGIIATERLQKVMVFGELSLSGAIRPVHGVLAAALAAKCSGCTTLLVSEENAPEASLVRDLTVRQVKHFNDAIYYLKTGDEPF